MSKMKSIRLCASVSRGKHDSRADRRWNHVNVGLRSGVARAVLLDFAPCRQALEPCDRGVIRSSARCPSGFCADMDATCKLEDQSSSCHTSPSQPRC